MYRIRKTVGSVFNAGRFSSKEDHKKDVIVLKDSCTTKDVIKYIVHHLDDTTEKNRSFTVLNIDHLLDQVNKWHKWMPRVTPYYAVKCSNSEIILEVLASLGLNFDCASVNEITQVLEAGAKPGQIIFANTVKPGSSIKFAKTNSINLLTFDSDIELLKIKEHHPNSRLLIRIRSDAQTAINTLGNKFGCCPIKEAPILLQIAKDLELNIVGVCFHVGSLCDETIAYITGIKMAKRLFVIGSILGFDMNIVDIGGGFPGDSDARMETITSELNAALEKYFPHDEGVKIIAEPGRFFVSSAYTLACLVHSARRPLSIIKGIKSDGSNKSGERSVETQSECNSEIMSDFSEIFENEIQNDEVEKESSVDLDEICEFPSEQSQSDEKAREDIVIGCDEMSEKISEFIDKTNNCQNDKDIMYFMDNGIYSSFAGILWNRLTIKPEPLEHLPDDDIQCSLWGPTCDGRDMICAKVSLPPLPIPSWLIFPHFGAYTCTTSTNFNGYTKPLHYTFATNTIMNYVKRLSHNKRRNKIKWIKIKTHINKYPIQRQVRTMESQLSFEKLHQKFIRNKELDLYWKQINESLKAREIQQYREQSIADRVQPELGERHRLNNLFPQGSPSSYQLNVNLGPNNLYSRIKSAINIPGIPKAVVPFPTDISACPIETPAGPSRTSASPIKISVSPSKTLGSPKKTPASQGKSPASPGKSPASPGKTPGSPSKTPDSPNTTSPGQAKYPCFGDPMICGPDCTGDIHTDLN